MFVYHCTNADCAMFDAPITSTIEFPEVVCGTCGDVLAGPEPEPQPEPRR